MTKDTEKIILFTKMNYMHYKLIANNFSTQLKCEMKEKVLNFRKKNFSFNSQILIKVSLTLVCI